MNENTINIVRLQATQGPTYDATLAIFEEAFPLSERRPIDSVNHILRYEDRFECHVITGYKQSKDLLALGFISQWLFDDFIYIEYLAVSKEYRGLGYGSILLEAVLNEADKPVVLEVELPTNEVAARRIRFYEKYGFVEQPDSYQQPSYGKVPGVPMVILRYDKKESSLPTSAIIKDLRQFVYGCKE